MEIQTATNPESSADFSSAMSVEEFGQRYGIGRSKVYLENKAGRLKFRKVGTRTLILKGDAERWAQSLPEFTA